MDQAISCLAEAGSARLIDFAPLHSQPVSLLPGSVFIISNTLASAGKVVTAASGFNLRVVEGRLAAKVVASKLSIDQAGINTLKDLHEAMSDAGAGGNDVKLQGMQRICAFQLHEEPYTAEEITELLGVEISQPVSVMSM